MCDSVCVCMCVYDSVCVRVCVDFVTKASWTFLVDFVAETLFCWC